MAMYNYVDVAKLQMRNKDLRSASQEFNKLIMGSTLSLDNSSIKLRSYYMYVLLYIHHAYMNYRYNCYKIHLNENIFYN